MISFVFPNPTQKKFAICRKGCPPVGMSMRRYDGGSVWDINNLGHSRLCHFTHHQLAVVALDGGHLVFGLAEAAAGLSHRSRGAKRGQMLPGSMKNYNKTTQYRTMLRKGS